MTAPKTARAATPIRHLPHISRRYLGWLALALLAISFAAAYGLFVIALALASIGVTGGGT